mgnify:CR=1 FL=1
MEKTFIIFGCGHNEYIRKRANETVEKFFKVRGAVAVPFDEKNHIKPDAVLYCSRSLFAEKNGEVTFFITKVSGKAICSFIAKNNTAFMNT